MDAIRLCLHTGRERHRCDYLEHCNRWIERGCYGRGKETARKRFDQMYRTGLGDLDVHRTIRPDGRYTVGSTGDLKKREPMAGTTFDHYRKIPALVPST